MTPDLFEAAFFGDTRDIERSLNAGQEAGCVNKHGQTALHIAAANGHVACIASGWYWWYTEHVKLTEAFSDKTMLVNRGVNVDTLDNNQCTPLHWATRHGHLDAIKFLLENGASSERTTGKGYTLMTLARGQGNSDVVHFLKQKLGIVKGLGKPECTESPIAGARPQIADEPAEKKVQ
ncbi:serine/threonine-protein phosphatase 6 regulatory ankyrin repeat subunit B-like [Liolophura sinensis]|uniref:serine/threonine-protein phosphatase 6 regulatory ankyrin repeat subunit B-like n=1 Tax=Liolophura sinensis TaxID=3198878 RepID=UPI0031589C32